MLRASSAAHPRLHALWPTLLALLLPGYSIARVRGGTNSAGTPESICWPDCVGTRNPHVPPLHSLGPCPLTRKSLAGLRGTWQECGGTPCKLAH